MNKKAFILAIILEVAAIFGYAYSCWGYDSIGYKDGVCIGQNTNEVLTPASKIAVKYYGWDPETNVCVIDKEGYHLEITLNDEEVAELSSKTLEELSMEAAK